MAIDESLRKAADPRPRTAVVVVHGMGDQRPMETVRGIAEALWTSDPSACPPGRPAPRYWVKPSPIDSLGELAVLTTDDHPASKRRIDFHEFYWAHQMAGTKAVSVLVWLFSLLKKGPRTNRSLLPYWWGGALLLAGLTLAAVTLVVSAFHLVVPVAPPGSVPGALIVSGVAALILGVAGGSYGLIAFVIVYVAGLLLAAVGLFLSLAGIAVAPSSPGLWMLWAGGSPGWLAVSLLLVGAYAIADRVFLSRYFGDVARYFRASPSNIETRSGIRRAGADLLERLHASGRYDRIVVVAHSLGSVVAYDLLRARWAAVVGHLTPEVLAGLQPELDTVDGWRLDAPRTVPWTGEELSAFRAAQRAFSRKLAAVSVPASKVPSGNGAERLWLVSDFVTLGSPLAHIEFLLNDPGVADGEEAAPAPSIKGVLSGSDRAALMSARWTGFKQRLTEREWLACPAVQLEDDGRLLYVAEGGRRVHHGAAFSVTRWTNLYVRAGPGPATDFIGGPISPVLGPGVEDVMLTERVRGGSLFAHLWYWLPGEGADPPHLAALRRAVDLGEQTAASDPAEQGGEAGQPLGPGPVA